MTKVKVVVLAREGKVWEGEGESCSMANTVGPFDILVEHAHLVSPIAGKVVVRDAGKIVWDYTLPESGLCRVKDNQVTVWVGI